MPVFFSLLFCLGLFFSFVFFLDNLNKNEKNDLKMCR